jgi:hypothetical protein
VGIEPSLVRRRVGHGRPEDAIEGQIPVPAARERSSPHDAGAHRHAPLYEVAPTRGSLFILLQVFAISIRHLVHSFLRLMLAAS